MKDKFEVFENLMQLEEILKEQKPYTIVSVSTTGLDTEKFTEHSPMRVNMTQYEYNESIKKHERTITFDKLVQAPEKSIQEAAILNEANYDVFKNNGIDKESYLKGDGVLSKEDFKKEFDLFCNAMKQSDSTLIVNGEVSFATQYLDKIGCGDRIREFEKEDKTINQLNLTQEYFKKNEIKSGTTLEDLRNSLLASPKGSFLNDKEKMKSFGSLSKEDFLKENPQISEKEYNATEKDKEIKSKKIIGGDSRIKVINSFIEKHGRDVGIIEDELQSHYRENDRGMAESYSKKGKEDYNKSSFNSKFKFFVEKGIINPEEIKEGKGEFHKLIDTIEGKKGHKGIIIAHASSSGFEKDLGSPQNMGQPLQFTAMVYQIKDGKPDFSKENPKNKFVNMNIQIPELSLKRAEERISKGEFDTFKDAGIDLKKYKNKEGDYVKTQNKAVDTIDTFFKTYPLEDYALIFLDSAGSKGQSFTQTCMSNLANFPMCNAKEYIDMSKVIKEYAFITCKEHETEYADKNVLFNEGTMKDKNFGIKAVAEANNVENFFGSAKKCYFTGNIIKALEQQQVEMFRPEELEKEKPKEITKKEVTEKFIDEGYENVSPKQIDKEEQRRIERAAQSQMIEQNIDAISNKPYIPKENSFRIFEKNSRADENKRQIADKKDNTIPFERKTSPERTPYQREPQREPRQTADRIDSGLDVNRLVEVILKQNEMISEQSRTISELNSKMFDVLAQQNEVMRAFVERAGDLHKSEPVHEVQQEKKLSVVNSMENIKEQIIDLKEQFPVGNKVTKHLQDANKALTEGQKEIENVVDKKERIV